MAPARTSPEDILARMRVPDEPGMFVVGCFERPATLYMQQVRALNLIYALNATGRATDTSLVVIGAGAGGLTAASAAAVLGWHVTVLERYAGDVLSLAGAVTSTRWLHPHIYDWPAAGTEDPSTKLGILDWSAGPANEVIEQLRRAWQSIERAHGIETHPGIDEVSIEALGEGYFVQWNGSGPRSQSPVSGRWGERPGRRIRSQRADLVVLAVGFGVEEPTPAFPPVKSYWEPDRIDQHKIGASQQPLVLISGTGDGGLIDALRYSFSNFRHEEILDRLRSWLGEPAFTDVKVRLRAIEQEALAARAIGREHEAALNLAYRELVDSLQIGDSLTPPLPLRSDVCVVLTGSSRFPLSLDAAPINRFLFALTNAQYVPGPLKRVVERDGRWDVWLRDEDVPRAFGEVLVRHGPTPTLRRYFPDVDRRCDPLRALVKRVVRDPTRVPCYDHAFATTLADAGRRMQPRDSAADRDAALRRADSATTPPPVLSRYRSAIAARFEAAGTSLVAQLVLVREADGKRVPEAGAFDVSWLRAGAGVRVIRGAMGTGKSLLVRWLAREAARDPTLIPLYVECRELSFPIDESLCVAAIDHAIASSTEAEALRAVCLRAMLQGRLIVFLDGIGELLSPERRAEVVASISADRPNLRRGNRVVITSYLDFVPPAALEAEVLEVLPSAGADDAVLHESIRATFSGSKWSSELMSAMPPIARARLFHSSASPVRNARELLDRWLNAVAGPVHSRLSDGLGELALLTVTTPRFTRGAIVRASELARSAGSETTPDELLGVPLIVAHPDGVTFSFQHRILQELVAARLLARRYEPRELIALAFRAPLVETDVIPLALGYPTDTECISILEAMQDSIDLAVLRLRLRVGCYRGSLSADETARLGHDLERVVSDPRRASTRLLSRLGEACAGLPRALAAVIATRIGAVLASPDPVVRCRAIAFLEDAAIREAVGLITPLLQAPEDEVRRAAAHALGELGDPAAIPALRVAYVTGALQHSQVFSDAVEAIERIGRLPAALALSELLSDRSLYANLRWPAAKLLGRLQHPRGLSPLLEACTDRAEVVRAAAAEALGRFDDPRASAALVARLDDPEVTVRIAAAPALVAIADRSHVARLVQALSDSHAAVREGAARALRRVDSAQLLARLREIIADARDPWRGDAVVLAAELLGDEALRLLLQLSQDVDDKLRWGAVVALAEQVGAGVDSRLVEAIDDPAEEVRYEAVEALGHRLVRHAAEDIARRLRLDAGKSVAVAAIKALGQLGGDVSANTLANTVADGGWLAAIAARWLATVAGPQAIAILAAAWRADVGADPLRTRGAMASAIAVIDTDAAAMTLRELVGSADAPGRRHLVNALALMTVVAAVPVLLLLWSDADDAVSTEACWALQVLPLVHVRAGLELALRDGHPAVEQRAAELWPFYEQLVD